MSTHSTHLPELFRYRMRLILSLEEQLVEALQAMTASARERWFKQAVRALAKETENHVRMARKNLELMDVPLHPIRCHALDGILRELAAFEEDGSAADVQAMFRAQMLEIILRYKIAQYGYAADAADRLHLSLVGELLRENLEEARIAAHRLRELTNRTDMGDVLRQRVANSRKDPAREWAAPPFSGKAAFGAHDSMPGEAPSPRRVKNVVRRANT